MSHPTDHPLLIFVAALLAFWLATRVGQAAHRTRQLDAESREDLGVVLAASLTLLGLLIGFAFSMAVSRFDQRKTYEEAEANAIGTEYIRTGLQTAAEGALTRGLLDRYLDQRIQFYAVRDDQRLQQLAAETERLQPQLWQAVAAPALAQPNSLSALLVSGMNDVFDAQGYAQAGWWNRIPAAAWLLMAFVALVCNVLLGFNAREAHSRSILSVILPLILAIALCLIADIDSPRGGVIHVVPQNLLSLQRSTQAHPD
jgi:hypothetical protein